MNRECYGTKFLHEGVMHYRCLDNGHITTDIPINQEKCPECHRPAIIGGVLIEPPYRDIRKISIPDLGWVHFKYLDDEKKGG